MDMLKRKRKKEKGKRKKEKGKRKKKAYAMTMCRDIILGS